MKKVLFIIDSLTCGGAEKSLISLLPLLDYNKLIVDLMLIKRGGVFEQYIPTEVHIKSFPPIKGIHKIWYIIGRLFFSFLLRFYSLLGIKRHGAEIQWMSMKTVYSQLADTYDVAIAYQQGFPTYYLASKVVARKKIAWINVDLQKAGYRQKFNRPFYDKMNYVIPVSDILYKMLKDTQYVNIQKLYAVYDILNVELIREMSIRQGFEDKLSGNSWRILTVGRMTKQKNYQLAVKTAKLLKKKGLLFRWYFIGDGSEYTNVKNLIKNNGLKEEVILLGMKSNPYPYMAGCDIYVQTSSFEGYCLTLCEARILHKPEVCTNFPVVYNQIRDGVNGLIAEMTPESVCDKIMQLVHNKELRETLIANTYKENNRTAITESAKVNALLLE